MTEATKRVRDVLRELHVEPLILLKAYLGKDYDHSKAVRTIEKILWARWDARREAGPPAGYVNTWPVAKVRAWLVAWPNKVHKTARERWDSNPGVRSMFSCTTLTCSRSRPGT